MKKFLKVFIVILLVIGVIGGTCYFFFYNLRKRHTTTGSIAAYLISESKIMFNSDLGVVNSIMNDNSDTRFDLIVETNNKLDSIMSAVTSYYVENNTQIKGKNIVKANNATKGSKIQLQLMMNEYKLKSGNSSYFDKVLGANDMYLQACTYLLNYAQTISLIQNTLAVNRNSNVKFNLYDVYTHVVLQTFNKTNIEQLRTAPLKVNSDASIKLMNKNMKFEGYTLSLTNPTSNVANNFDNYYSICDRSDFALNLATNVQTVTNADQTTNEKMATYYLKSLFGI